LLEERLDYMFHKKDRTQEIEKELEELRNTLADLKNTVLTKEVFDTTLTARTIETQRVIEGAKSEILIEMNRDADIQEETPSDPIIINKERIENLTPKKLNIGCGRDILQDYINIDYRELPGVDVVASVDKLPFKNNTVQEIYLSHVLEHFTETRAKNLLLYWFELLIPGGILVIRVPNIEVMARDYANGEIDWQNLRQIILGGQDYIGDFHYNAFSEESLKDLINNTLDENAITIETITHDRQIGMCKEMEIKVIKK